MARSVTIGEIVNRARILSDMRHSNFISPADALTFANICYPELYDTLVSSFQNYYVAAPFNISIAPGTSLYNLPNDFYKAISLDLQQGAGDYTSIFLFNENERNSILGSAASSLPNGTVRLRYVPAPMTFTATTDLVDGVSGWEALLSYDLAIMFLQAEESDASALERKRMQLMNRIVSSAQNRDITQPGRITDTTVMDNPLGGPQLRYRFYGDQVEFIDVTYVGV